VPADFVRSRVRAQILQRDQRHRIAFLATSQSGMSGKPTKVVGIANAACLRMTTNEPRDPETYQIIGAAMAVHSELGCGFLEKVYKLALPFEFAERHVVFKSEVELPISYKTHALATKYYADFICFDGVVVEVKAQSALGNADVAQLLNYLKASGIRRGLLLNFGTTSLQYQRLVRG
jgi:GxxExxY protein